MKIYQACSTITLILALGVSPSYSQNFKYESEVGFPDFGFMESPEKNKGPVFVLSDSFPETNPDLDAEVLEILKIDFEADPMKYALAVRDYVFKGNIRGGDVSQDFVLQNNSENISWYHVPWQHWGPSGREGYHGLTREGPLNTQVLAPEQTKSSSAYAVGFYNGPGGYTLGQVWPDPSSGPDLSHMIKAMENGFAFPEGTVVGKFLFTSLDETQVPWLNNPLQWDAYMYDCDFAGSSCDNLEARKRNTHPVNLLQMDIMVKDPRATEAGGWVFGTFTYSGSADQAENSEDYMSACEHIPGAGKNWCNLMPVGVMWGNDPDNAETFINKTPTKTVINPNLEETWINPDSKLPAMHLGFNSRLNGPADNPTSSCMSCHAVGQVPSISPIMPWLTKPAIPIPADGTIADQQWMHWFRNFEDGEAFDQGLAVSMDFSMQLTKSIENYIEYSSKTEGGNYALQYWGDSIGEPISRGAEMPAQ